MRSCLPDKKDWKRDDVKKKIKSSPIQSLLLLKQWRWLLGGVSSSAQRGSCCSWSSDNTQEPSNMRSRERRSRVTASWSFFHYGAEPGGIYNQLEVWFQLSSPPERRCFGFLFNTLGVSKSEPADMRWFYSHSLKLNWQLVFSSWTRKKKGLWNSSGGCPFKLDVSSHVCLCIPRGKTSLLRKNGVFFPRNSLFTSHSWWVLSRQLASVPLT